MITITKLPVTTQGGLSSRKWSKSFQLHTFTKSEGHHRPPSEITTPMTVLYRARADDLGANWANRNTNLAMDFCKTIARKDLIILATFLLKDHIVSFTESPDH